jgi:hypothetical protein
MAHLLRLFTGIMAQNPEVINEALTRLIRPQARGRRRKAKLPTIARLVVLTYICSGLAVDEKGRLLVWGSDPPRELTVDRVYDRLLEANLG